MTSTLTKITDLVADTKLDDDPSFSYWNDAKKEKKKHSMLKLDLISLKNHLI